MSLAFVKGVRDVRINGIKSKVLCNWVDESLETSEVTSFYFERSSGQSPNFIDLFSIEFNNR